MTDENKDLAKAALAVVAVGIGIAVISKSRGSRSVDIASIMANVKASSTAKPKPKAKKKARPLSSHPLVSFLHFKHGSSDKFWFIRQDGASITQHWGRVGTVGQSKSWLFGSPGDARDEALKRRVKKKADGYATITKRKAAKIAKGLDGFDRRSIGL